MTTLKKFAMAVMLLTGFQQASADVCKLKVNLTQDEEKVVLNGLGYIFKGDLCIANADKYAYSGYGTSTIYCNSLKEVVINLREVRSEDRVNIAKRQFENIIKCGLVDNHIINAQIYNTPFTDSTRWKMPGISADISNLTLTSIPVMCAMKRDIKTEVNIHKNSLKSYIDNNQLFSPQSYFDNQIDRLRREAYLYCGLKDLNKIKTKLTSNDKEKTINDIISTERTLLSQEMNKRLIMRNNWEKIFSPEKCDFSIGATEHTERQLLVYHCLNNPPVEWLTDASDSKLCNVTPYEAVKQNNYNSSDSKHLLIYTHGAPCFDEDGKCKDNGGMCCWNLYRDCIPNNINVDVYFSQFMYYELADNTRCKNILGKLPGIIISSSDKLKNEVQTGDCYKKFEDYLKASDWKDKPNIQIHWVNHSC